jgi:hypothetical protein
MENAFQATQPISPYSEPTELEKLFRLELVALAMQKLSMSRTDILLAYYEPDLDFDGYLNHPDVTIECSTQLERALIKELGGTTLLKSTNDRYHHFARRILESDLEL